MARKAKPHDEELPFVALMDTMTNVVGVLIIVLVMIGIGLAKSVKKVLSELPLVSEEEHVKLKEELAKIDTSHDPAEVAADTAKLQKELEKALETQGGGGRPGQKSRGAGGSRQVDQAA
jgi:septal ring-binding cell division protein DamX